MSAIEEHRGPAEQGRGQPSALEKCGSGCDSGFSHTSKIQEEETKILSEFLRLRDTAPMDGLLGKALPVWDPRAHLGVAASTGALQISTLPCHLTLSPPKATVEFRAGNFLRTPNYNLFPRTG